MVVSVYFLRDGHIAAAHRTVETTKAAAAAALRDLLNGPNSVEASAGLSSAIPAGTRLLSVTLRDGIATVDLTRGFQGDRARLAQVVFTATQFPSVSWVRFRLDGKDVFGYSLNRAAFPDVTPAILVENPTPGDMVRSPLTVMGSNNTFEGATSFQLLDGGGRSLAEAYGSGGTMGEWRPFTAHISFDPLASVTGTLVAFDRSARDGSMLDVVRIPVRFGS
jgi:hypothetical protein